MLFQRFRRCSKAKKKEYNNKVAKYAEINGIKILQEMCDKTKMSLNGLSVEKLLKILDTDFPKAPWVKEEETEKQVRCLLRQMGYIFECDINGNIFFKNIDEYENIVKNHLKLTGANLISNLSYYCHKTHGRISYEIMAEILGYHYPKAPYIRTKDQRIQIVLFMLAVGLPCRFDNNHLYLP